MYRHATLWLTAWAVCMVPECATAATTYSSTDVPKTIGPASTTRSTLQVDDPGPINNLTVELDISFIWDEDLQAYLISPDNQRVELFTNVGGIGMDFTRTVLDDAAAVSIADGQAPFTGRYRPEGRLGDFVGKERQGVWTLEVVNDGEWFTGTLNSWAITLDSEPGQDSCPSPPQPVVPDPADGATGVPTQTAVLSWRIRASSPPAFRFLATTGEETPDPFSIFELQTDPAGATRIGDSCGVYALDVSPAGELYGCSEYALWKLKMVEDGVTCEKVGDFRSLTDDSVLMTGLAFHPNGTLYGSTFDQISFSSVIFRIDEKTAFVTEVCRFSMLEGLVWAIDFSPDGDLYAAFLDLALVDMNACEVHRLGSVVAGDLDWAPDGFLYAVDTESRMLYRIDPALGLVMDKYGPYEITPWGLASEITSQPAPANLATAYHARPTVAVGRAHAAGTQSIRVLKADLMGLLGHTDASLRLTATAGAASAEDGDPNYVTYDVYLDTTNPPTALACRELESPPCHPGELEACKTYYWQVVARNVCGATAGPVWSFTTESVPADFDKDCDVDFNDLAVFASYWLFDSQ